MSETQPVSIGRRLAWIGAATVGCFVAASLVPALFRTLSHMLRGEPAAVSALLQSPAEWSDLAGVLILFAIMATELARNGWQGSALRRVLRQDDVSTRADLLYFVLSATGLIKIAATVATIGIGDALVAATDIDVRLRPFAALPLYVGVPCVIIIQSFVQYWCHRALHTPLLWHLHAVHHAADDFNIVTSLRHHPATSIFYWVIVVVPALLFSTEAMLVGMIIVNGHSTYVHADLPTSRVFERWFFFGPNGHGIHHGTVPSCFDKNFGDLVIWDRLFGTYKSDAPQPLVYGCADPEGIYQSGHPLRDMVAVQMSWLRTLWNAARTRSTSATQAA